MKIIAVIGAMFGDEGKGKMTNYFASTADAPAVVIRHNGGAQAGHTVVHDGIGHVFHHFGSGTLAKVPTFLSQYFISNPMTWSAEYFALKGYGINPRLFVDPSSPITTPYDMLINQEIERTRGKKRHGSCGIGFNETVERMCESEHRVFYYDINTNDYVRKIESIRDEYVPNRLKALGIDNPSEMFTKACGSSDLLDVFFANSMSYYNKTTPILEPELKQFSTLIFESAQGLGLDAKHKYFPHVTRSHPGMQNIVFMIHRNAWKPAVEVVYVTRAYTTRHGAGPLPTERESVNYSDTTNVLNKWQGEFRQGHLDCDMLKEHIVKDLKQVDVKCTVGLAITCMDQVGANIQVLERGQYHSYSSDVLSKRLLKMIKGTNLYLGWKK